MLRLFERAVSRADLPVRYSEGFNPRPCVCLPLPRSVGVASDDELFVMTLVRHESPDRVCERLARQLPTGIALGETVELARQGKPRAVEATYRLDLAGESRPELAEAARQIMSADHLEVQRVAKKDNRCRTIDLRAWIARVDVRADVLTVILRISPEGSARPAEVLELLGLDATEALARLRRVAVQWEGLMPGKG